MQNYTINELRQEIFGKVFEVYEIFKNYFEPQYVDLQDIPLDEDLLSTMETWDITETEHEGVYQGTENQWNNVKNDYHTLKPYILVWWPRVTVTNENNRSVNIQDLYAKIQVTVEGKIPYEYRGFQLTRTTFPEVQFNCGYLHSHIPSFHGLPYFANPCLGTGPINNTIMDLHNDYEETLWMLFCRELSLYVTVESLRGGPYFRMENIGSSKKLSEFNGYSYDNKTINELFNSNHYARGFSFETFKDIIGGFLPYYLERGHLSFDYKNEMFVAGMPYYDFIIDISNAFIDYFNAFGTRGYRDALFEAGVLKKALVSNGAFYRANYQAPQGSSSLEGIRILTFKGEDKLLHIIHEEEVHLEETTLLDHKVASFILNNILKIINYRYRNEHNKQLGNNTGGSEEASAPTYQTVYYI